MLTSRWRRTAGYPALACAIAVLLVGVGAEDTVAQHLKGRVAGGKYTSPRGLFIVTLPKPRNWAGVPFTIEEDTETRERNYDAAFFWVKDFGEVMIAGVRRIPQAALDDMAASNPPAVAQGLADMALLDWRQYLTERPTLAFDSFVATQYGQTTLGIYEVEKGSLLVQESGGRKPERFDILIGVMAVKRNDHYIYAIAEDDANPLDQDGTQSAPAGIFRWNRRAGNAQIRQEVGGRR